MKRTALYLLLALLSAWPLHAQNTGFRTTMAAPATGMQIRFGQAMIPLTGPWKFHIGDDPRWADPKFDDSSWETVDLGAKEESIDPIMGTGGYSPGWTAATLANAGHLPPYLNGKELPMEGAVPLGMTPDAEFTVMSFQLEPGDRLLLLSDGVAEAQDERGQLFGFERIHALVRSAVSAAEIATAAQNFGQQDDISVLSVTRSGVREAAMTGVG